MVVGHACCGGGTDKGTSDGGWCGGRKGGAGGEVLVLQTVMKITGDGDDYGGSKSNGCCGGGSDEGSGDSGECGGGVMEVEAVSVLVNTNTPDKW